MAEIAVKNLPDVIRILYDLDQALKDGEMGRVYSKGADQGRGNYEHWVQSEERQTWFHNRTGWRTDEKTVEEFEPIAEKLFEQTAKDLGDKGKALDIFRKFTKEIMQQIYDYWTWYPPEPAGSQYVRTGTLHRSWDIKIAV